MPSHADLDRQIEHLMECKPLSETEVKTLCEQARTILVEEWNVQPVKCLLVVIFMIVFLLLFVVIVVVVVIFMIEIDLLLHLQEKERDYKRRLSSTVDILHCLLMLYVLV
ncbi:hypothetical protein AQUCO_00100882v1 [Aquilegia coerulea]|uniref:Uncharacterized protein n=1 Tax=Aquilegia coerulea TaxID=218851 RepID=A0A2G5FCD2_AQUCA|nr:hypothetical protein AQUCO_00100882v1 [Aquilegia coerulea]